MQPLFEVEGAKSKRPLEDDDHFAFEPMGAATRSGELRRNPTTDQKKDRHRAQRVAKSAHPYECTVCDREFDDAGQANAHELGNPKHRVQKTAGLDYYDIEAHFNDGRPPRNLNGGAFLDEMIAEATEMWPNPSIDHLFVVHREDGVVIWKDGEVRSVVYAAKTAAGLSTDIKWRDLTDDESTLWAVTYDSPNLHGEALVGEQFSGSPFYWEADAKARQGDMAMDYHADGQAFSVDEGKRAVEEALKRFERQQEATVVYDLMSNNAAGPFPWNRHSSLIERSASIHQSIVNHTKGA